MGTTDRELKQIAANIERMAAADPPTGWQIRPGHAEATWIVASPNTTDVVTFGARVGSGQGKQKAIAELRRIGYFDDWTRYRVEVAAKRQAADIPDPFHVPTQAGPVEPATETPGETVTATPADMPARSRATIYSGTETHIKIDGKAVAIVTREPATFIPPSGTEPAALTGVDRILLDNGREMYQCVTCWDAFETPNSAGSHLRKHGNKALRAFKAQRTAQMAEASRVGHELRAARRTLLLGDETRAEFLVTLVAQLNAAVPVLSELSRMRVEQDTAELEAVQQELEAALQLIEEQQDAAQRYADIEGKFGKGVTVADLEALAVKAKKWDNFVAARDAV